MLIRRALITWISVVCCIGLTVWGCTTSQEETGMLEGFLWNLEGKTPTETMPCEHTSSNSVTTKTIPGGYLELTVTPAEVCAHAGEHVDIRCTMVSLVDTPLEVTSVSLDLFDSHDSLIRKQLMILETRWSAKTTYMIVGDEAYCRLLIDFAINPMMPEYFSEYAGESLPIAIDP
jgi:hypothetical protein